MKKAAKIAFIFILITCIGCSSEKLSTSNILFDLGQYRADKSSVVLVENLHGTGDGDFQQLHRVLQNVYGPDWRNKYDDSDFALAVYYPAERTAALEDIEKKHKFHVIGHLTAIGPCQNLSNGIVQKINATGDNEISSEGSVLFVRANRGILAK